MKTEQEIAERAEKLYPYYIDDEDRHRADYFNRGIQGNREAYIKGATDMLKTIDMAEEDRLRKKGFELLDKVNELVVEKNKLNK